MNSLLVVLFVGTELNRHHTFMDCSLTQLKAAMLLLRLVNWFTVRDLKTAISFTR
jgi:hypothetical protein